MLKPVTATVIIMTGTTVWNDYALSVYLLTDADKQTIAPRVASFFAANSSNLGTAAAAALIAAAPMVIAYLFLLEVLHRRHDRRCGEVTFGIKPVGRSPCCFLPYRFPGN